MELVELHVHHLRACQVSQRHAVSRGHLRIGGVPVQPAGPARAHHHHAAAHDPPFAGATVIARRLAAIVIARRVRRGNLAPPAHHLNTGHRAVLHADADGVGVLQHGD